MAGKVNLASMMVEALWVMKLAYLGSIRMSAQVKCCTMSLLPKQRMYRALSGMLATFAL